MYVRQTDSVISQRAEKQVLIPEMKVEIGTISEPNSEKTAMCSKSGDSLLLHHECCTTQLKGVSRVGVSGSGAEPLWKKPGWRLTNIQQINMINIFFFKDILINNIHYDRCDGATRSFNDGYCEIARNSPVT